MDDTQTTNAARLAVTVGLVAAGSAVCLGAYFVVGGPLGTINDVGNAATGVLSAALAWRLRSHVPGRAGAAAVAAAMAGAALTTAGTALVVSGTTSFLLAGLVSSVGFSGIGAWLVALNRSGAEGISWSRRVRTLGLLAGALMATGVAALPGIALRLDDVATAPGWVWIGFIGWLGIYVVYPAWAIAMGVSTMRRERRMPLSRATAA